MTEKAKRIEQHKAKWLHNRKFLASIPDEFSDWIVTVAFYAALHCFEMLSASDGNRPHASHEDRRQTLKRVTKYQKIYEHYGPLYDASSGVRYLDKSKSWVSAETAKQKFVRHYLRQIEASVLPLVGISDKPEDIFPPSHSTNLPKAESDA